MPSGKRDSLERLRTQVPKDLVPPGGAAAGQTGRRSQDTRRGCGQEVWEQGHTR
jgi:hypothetical protein